MRIKDIAGLRFEKLVAIKSSGKRSNGTMLWLCKCDCGNETIVRGDDLRSGHTKSCGCLKVTKEKLQKMHNARRKHFGCMYCGSDKHYAKGLCMSCYNKVRRGSLE